MTPNIAGNIGPNGELVPGPNGSEADDDDTGETSPSMHSADSPPLSRPPGRLPGSPALQGLSGYPRGACTPPDVNGYPVCEPASSVSVVNCGGVIHSAQQQQAASLQNLLPPHYQPISVAGDITCGGYHVTHGLQAVQHVGAIMPPVRHQQLQQLQQSQPPPQYSVSN